MPNYNVPIITASLCDSRSCNQTGGGEYLKSDIEDLLSLLPAADDIAAGDVVGGGQHERGGRHRQHRVTLTTCFGLCNNSPNIHLKSKGGGNGGSSLRQRRGKLVNDGGLRMRVVEGEDTIMMEATDTAMVSNATISKVAAAMGLKRPHHHAAVRALECKSQGNKFLRNGAHDDALECYFEGRALLLTYIRRGDCGEADAEASDGNSEGDDGLRSSANKLLSKITLSCAETRVQWASELGNNGEKEEAMKLLQLAAGDAFRVLLKSVSKEGTNGTTEISSSDETNDADVHCIIAKLEHCSAGLQTQRFISKDEGRVLLGSSDTRKGEEDEDEGLFVPSLSCDDVTLMVQFCVMLADAWRGLAARSDNNDPDDADFANGALIAYRGALAVASASKVRVLRAKERRRIEKAMTDLE